MYFAFFAQIALAAAVIFTFTFPAAAVEYVVEAEQAACLRDHADAYLSNDKPIYIIVAADCPEIDSDLSDDTTANSIAGPRIPGPSFPERTGNGIVVLTPGHLRCLRDRPEDVIRPGDNGLVRINFDAC